jgi:hypothetical protein
MPIFKIVSQNAMRAERAASPVIAKTTAKEERVPNTL